MTPHPDPDGLQTVHGPAYLVLVYRRGRWRVRCLVVARDAAEALLAARTVCPRLHKVPLAARLPGELVPGPN